MRGAQNKKPFGGGQFPRVKVGKDPLLATKRLV